MSEAQKDGNARSAVKKEVSFIKGKIPNLDENKLKSLEARFMGPSSNGTMPIDCKRLMEMEMYNLESMSEGVKGRESNEDAFNDNSNRAASASEANPNVGNSNKSYPNNSAKKKGFPKRAERKTKLVGNMQIDFLSAKRNRDSHSNNIVMTNSNQGAQDDFIEFSSKNINPQTPLFNNTLNAKIASNSTCCIRDKKDSQSNNNLPQNRTVKSETKINEYFKIQTPSEKSFSLNNVNSIQSYPESTANKLLKKVSEDNEKIAKENNDIKKSLQLLEKENEKLKSIVVENEETLQNNNLVNKQLETQLKFSKKSLVVYLRELEETKRSQNKKWIAEQEFKLGKFVIQRIGQKTMDVWEQGEEYYKLGKKLKQILREKDELEKQKKQLNNFLRKRNTMSHEPQNKEEGVNENDCYEQKELISFKLAEYSREENELKERVDKLEVEKALCAIEAKRIREEETSRYGSSTSKEPWPVLSDRYLILSLLGKGGYSEVYRAYDLDNHVEVACKIHQLNSQWSDSIKENYIKHTIRENQIHKEINHPKVVKHYDTIEIDNSSFCTVLELCTGPDLYTYLKTHKAMPEKDSRTILMQILSGLEYLNKLNKRIIHYDLKPQNIIFHNKEVKISDFGLAKIMEDNSDKIELTSQGVGTYWYLPPECFDTSKNPPGISSKVDIWSVGVILYECLFGSRPFGHTFTQDKILKEGVITNATRVDFPNKPAVSEECKDFIKKCLTYKQEHRLDVFEALEHPFVKSLGKRSYR